MSEAPKPGPAQLIEDQPAPTDTQGEVDNAVDLLVDLATGKKTVRDVVATAFQKAFGGEQKPAAAERPKLRGIDGGK